MNMIKHKKNRHHSKAGVGIMGNGIDYSTYDMSAKEKLTGWAMGLVVGFFAAYLVVHNPLFSAVFGGIAGLFFIKPYMGTCMKKRDKELLLQFRDLMESLVSTYSAGSNPVDAFAASYKDMTEMYGSDSYMAREMDIINVGLANGFNIVSLLHDMADRMRLEDVKDFVDVFCITYEKGGDMRKVLFDTRMVISEKIEMEQDMKVQLRSNMNELKVLIVVPIIIDMVFRMDSSMSGTNSEIGGLVSRIVAVMLFIGAYGVGNYMLGKSQKQL